MQAGDWASSVPDLLVAEGRLRRRARRGARRRPAAFEAAVAEAAAERPVAARPPAGSPGRAGSSRAAGCPAGHPLRRRRSPRRRVADGGARPAGRRPLRQRPAALRRRGGIPTLHYGPGRRPARARARSRSRSTRCSTWPVPSRCSPPACGVPDPLSPPTPPQMCVNSPGDFGEFTHVRRGWAGTCPARRGGQRALRGIASGHRTVATRRPRAMPLDNPFYTPEMQGAYELRSIGRFELEEGGVIPDLRAGGRHLRHAERGQGQRDPASRPGSPAPTRPGSRPTSGRAGRWTREVLHRGDQPDRQRSLDLAAQHRRPVDRDVEVPEGAHRRRRRAPRSSCCASTSASSGWPSSSAGRWVRSRPTSGRSGSRTRCCAPRPIAGTAQNTPHDFLFTQDPLLDAITSDPGCAGGEYASHEDVADGLRPARGHLGGRSGSPPSSGSTEFWRGIQPSPRRLGSKPRRVPWPELHPAALRRDGPQRAADDGAGSGSGRRRAEHRR